MNESINNLAFTEEHVNPPAAEVPPTELLDVTGTTSNIEIHDTTPMADTHEQTSPTVSYSEQMRHNYDRYRETSHEIITNPELRASHLLGSGMNADAFWLKDNDRLLVIRQERDTSRAAHMVNGLNQAFAIGAKFKDRLQQAVASSPEEGIIITEYVEGVDSDKLSEEDVSNIPDDVWSKVIGTVREIQAAGIRLDTDGANLRYNKQTHIMTIMDYVPTDEEDFEDEAYTISNIPLCFGRPGTPIYDAVRTKIFMIMQAEHPDIYSIVMEREQEDSLAATH